ncbi:MarR family transcriptional regulator [Altererythrobacter soli]|uniref:MarR family transcriptional regulator n=1 Tax=Croceibacterium soli TaxID=1739690 RepID=A0A6I4UT20_9SPHN|nr:MarR family winged helix-turn-helix transcriptional regulator [Croceibacterium soli]MXP42052.1 MarR family transcriptional regulator [Croceibacterium soli]
MAVIRGAITAAGALKVARTFKAADPVDPSFKMEDWPFYWLVRVANRYSLELDTVLKRVGMDMPRWRVLIIVSELKSPSVSLIAEHAVIKLSTMTKIVQRLEIDGLVEKRVNAADARVTEVRLTPAGVDAVSRVRVLASRVFHRGFEGFGRGEIQALNQQLRRIFSNFDS